MPKFRDAKASCELPLSLTAGLGSGGRGSGGHGSGSHRLTCTDLAEGLRTSSRTSVEQMHFCLLLQADTRNHGHPEGPEQLGCFDLAMKKTHLK